MIFFIIAVLVGSFIFYTLMEWNAVGTFPWYDAYGPNMPPEYTKADLERDARRDWDEQVKALGCTEPELYFSKPYLSGERPIFNAGGFTFEEYHAAALKRFYAFSEGGVIGLSPPTTNELNS